MRKLLLALVLPLLLLASQQGRVWHEAQHLGHAAPAAKSSQGDKSSKGNKGQPADKLCESCLAFAQLGAAAPGGLPALLLADASGHIAPLLTQRVVAGDAPAPRSRGPPFFH